MKMNLLFFMIFINVGLIVSFPTNERFVKSENLIKISDLSYVDENLKKNNQIKFMHDKFINKSSILPLTILQLKTNLNLTDINFFISFSKTTNKSNSVVTNIEKPNLLSTENLVKLNSTDEIEFKNLTSNFNDDFFSDNSNFTIANNASYSLLGDEILNVNDPFYNKTDLINSTISNKNLDFIYDALNDTIIE